MKAEAKQKVLFILFTFFSLFMNVQDCDAQVSIWTNPITGDNPGQTNPFKTGEIHHANLTVSGIGRGTLVTGLNSTNTYAASNWPTRTTLDTAAYFNFIITPNTGYRFSVTSFMYTATEVFRSPDSVALRSNANANNFASNIGRATPAGTTVSVGQTSLSAATTYRLYGWRARGGSRRNWSINDFTFYGSVLGSATTSLSSFGYVYGSSTSAAQSFRVNGSGLTSNTVVISGSTNYEVSTTSSTSGFGSTATLTATSGTLNASNVWVRLKTGRSAGTYNVENITISCGNISNIPVSCSGTVTKKTLTITNAAAQNKMYDRSNNAVVTGSLSGLLGTDNVTLIGTGTFASINVANRIAVTSTSTLGGTHAANYTLTQPTGLTANITVRGITPQISVNNKTYDGNASATLNGGITLQNLVSGDVVNAAATSVNFNNKNAGNSKTVTATGITLSGAAGLLQNYTLISSSATATANISNRILIITASANNKVYDGNNMATVNLSDNRISNDQLSISFSSSTFSNASAGINKTVTISGLSISGTDAANYVISNNSVNTQANITARAVSITPVASNKIFGNADPQFTYNLSAGQLVYGDVFSGSLTRIAGEAVGTYAILQGNLSLSSNYQITYQSALFTIHPRNIILTVNPGRIICNGGTTLLSCSVTGAGTDVQYNINNGTAQSSGEFTVGAGTYTVRATDADGFSATSNSIIVTQPGIINSDFSTTRCDSYTLPWGGIVNTTGAYVHTYRSANGCDSIVTANVIIDTVARTISGPVNSCRYTLPTGDTATYSIAASSASGYLWSVPANAEIVSGQGTGAVRVLYTSEFTSGNISVTVTRGCGGNVTRNLTVTKVVPVVGLISGPLNACPFLETASSATYSVASNPNVLYYRWSISRGMSFANNDTTFNSIKVNFQSGFFTYPVNVVAVSGCAVSDTARLRILVSKPLAPVNIIGEKNACPFINIDTVVYYRTPKVITRGNYVWTVPQGITVVSHPGGIGTLNDTIIGVKFDSSFVAGSFITVQTVSACGISLLKNITINRSSAPVPSVIKGPSNSCPLKVGTHNPSGSQVIYKINKVRFAASYQWILPAGVTLLSRLNNNSNDTSIVVRFESNFTGGNIGVRSVTGCGVSAIRTISVRDVILGMPGNISGAINPCPLIGGPDTTTYRISKVPGAISYYWSVPQGASIVGRPGGVNTENDTVIVVRWTSAFVSGVVSVLPQNNCSQSRSARTLAIERKIPAVPSAINGPLNPCILTGNISTYSIAALPLNAKSVKWTAPQHAVIVGSDTSRTVQISFLSSFTDGTLAVKGINNCSEGSSKTMTISKRVPSMPGIITATIVSECPGRVMSYTISAIPSDAVSIRWTVPDGGTILRGQGTTSVLVSYNQLNTNGAVAVTTMDGCNQTGMVKSLNVSLSACTISGRTAAVQKSISSSSSEYEIAVSINTTANGFKIISGSTMYGLMNVRVCDLSGRMVEQFELKNSASVEFGSVLKPGIYFIELRQASKRMAKQLIKL